MRGIVPNPIFLLETTQMADINETRASEFRQKLQHYLGLHSELSPIPHIRPGKFKNKLQETPAGKGRDRDPLHLPRSLRSRTQSTGRRKDVLEVCR